MAPAGVPYVRGVVHRRGLPGRAGGLGCGPAGLAAGIQRGCAEGVTVGENGNVARLAVVPPGPVKASHSTAVWALLFQARLSALLVSVARRWRLGRDGPVQGVAEHDWQVWAGLPENRATTCRAIRNASARLGSVEGLCSNCSKSQEKPGAEKLIVDLELQGSLEGTAGPDQVIRKARQSWE